MMGGTPLIAIPMMAMLAAKANRHAQYKVLDAEGASMKLEGRYLTLKPEGNGLVVTLTEEGREELADRKVEPDFATFFNLFEDFAGNGWSTPSAEELGALTSCEIIIAWDDEVYWHERYQIEDAIEELLNGRLFLLKG